MSKNKSERERISKSQKSRISTRLRYSGVRDRELILDRCGASEGRRGCSKSLFAKPNRRVASTGVPLVQWDLEED